MKLSQSGVELKSIRTTVLNICWYCVWLLFKSNPSPRN